MTPPSGVELPLRRLRVDEYHAMVELGVLPDGVELIEGLIVEKRPDICQDDPFVGSEQWPLFRFTLDDYHCVRDAGLLDVGEPCEFIDGLLVETMIRRPPHDTALGLLHDVIAAHLPAKWVIRNQSALTLTDSEPEPDLAVVRGHRRDFAMQHPGPAETGLVVEVADATLVTDRTRKFRTYAKHSIPAYWILNLIDEQVEVFTQPSGLVRLPTYESQTVYNSGQSVPFVLDDQQIAVVPVDDILP